jgi:aerobic-type carbon monoxide dehydrogenase small subunit (CoxS/CutS family)
MASIKFAVDGKTVIVNADPNMPLLYALRNDLRMSNPHFGCGLAQCGALAQCIWTASRCAPA